MYISGTTQHGLLGLAAYPGRFYLCDAPSRSATASFPSCTLFILTTWLPMRGHCGQAGLPRTLQPTGHRCLPFKRLSCWSFRAWGGAEPGGQLLPRSQMPPPCRISGHSALSLLIPPEPASYHQMWASVQGPGELEWWVRRGSREVCFCSTPSLAG